MGLRRVCRRNPRRSPRHDVRPLRIRRTGDNLRPISQSAQTVARRTLMRHFHQQNAYRTKSPRTYGVSASDHPPRCPVRRALNLRRLSVVSNPPNR